MPRTKKTLGVRAKRSKRGSDSDATIADDDLQVQPPQPLPKPKKKQSKAKGVSARKPAKGKSQPPAAEVVEDSEEEEEEGEEEEEHEEQSDESSSQAPANKKAKKAPKKTVRPKAKTVKLARDSEIDLLDALKKVPALWSSGHEYLHFTKECKIPMWKKLGDDFNLSVEQVKQWYKNIRTQLGKYTDLPPSGSGAVKLTPRAEFIVQHASFIKGEITRIVGRVNTTLRYDRQKMNELETKRSMQAQLRPSQSTTSGSQEVSASQGTPAFPNLGTSDNEFEAYMDIRTANVSALIGPYAQPLVTSTERYAYPYFLLDTTDRKYYSPDNLIRVYPSISEVYSIVVHLIKRYKWSDVLVFYQDGDGSRLIEDLVQVSNLRLRAFKVHKSTEKRQIKQLLLEQRQIPVVNFVVLASRYWTSVILNEALYVSMLSRKHTWIVPSLNHDGSDFEPYAYTEVNLTTFDQVRGDFIISSPRPGFSQFEYAAVHDSLLTLYELTKVQMRNYGNCMPPGIENLKSNLQKVDVLGATGYLSYRADGSRDGYLVNLRSLGIQGLYQVGYWNSSIDNPDQRLVLTGPHVTSQIPALVYPLGKEVLSVVTILESPFVQLKKDHTDRVGNDKFEGYCIDLIEHIATEVDFQYKLYLVPDNKFGEEDEQGHWDGMIGEVLIGNASLVVSSITITSEREKVVDFAKPYKPRGLSLIMKKSQIKSSFFQFLDPLSPLVWVSMILVLVLVSLALFIIDKMAPKEQEGDVFKPVECVWFTFASLVLNSTDMVPRTVPGKILAGTLWFFSLILISNYTANLAAFLTISKFHTPINDVYDLAKQGSVKYGTVWHSATSSYFQKSRMDYFQKMWQLMGILNPGSMNNDSQAGIQRVKDSEGDYAFIWDEAVIRYEVNKDCDLMKVGDIFDGSKGYGIAMPKNAGYREDISIAILKLGENGILQQLEHRWWEPPSCVNDASESPTGQRQSLEISSIRGIFVVLCIGVFVAVVVAVCDFVMRRCKNQNKDTADKLFEEEKNNTAKSKTYLNEVNLTNNGQADECFLSQPNGPVPGCSKHTNIF